MVSWFRIKLSGELVETLNISFFFFLRCEWTRYRLQVRAIRFLTSAHFPGHLLNHPTYWWLKKLSLFFKPQGVSCSVHRRGLLFSMRGGPHRTTSTGNDMFAIENLTKAVAVAQVGTYFSWSSQWVNGMYCRNVNRTEDINMVKM